MPGFVALTILSSAIWLRHRRSVGQVDNLQRVANPLAQFTREFRYR
jgi:hypothetical protein